MSTVKFQISQIYYAPAGPLWPSMGKFGWVSKTHKKHGNFHNRGGSLLKLTSEVTTIGAHIVSKFQPCTPVISEVIAKSVLSNSFQDHLISRPLYLNILSGTAPLYMFGPYFNPCQDLSSQFSIKTGYLAIYFKTLAFSLFAAQWLQDSSTSNHQSLIGT